MRSAGAILASSVESSECLLPDHIRPDVTENPDQQECSGTLEENTFAIRNESPGEMAANATNGRAGWLCKSRRSGYSFDTEYHSTRMASTRDMTASRNNIETSLHLAAYLGHAPSRETLGEAALPRFTLQSMVKGGDKLWRLAMKMVGHDAVAAAACTVAEQAYRAYQIAPDAPDDVERMARDAVDAIREWQPQSSNESLIRLRSVVENFCLSVNVGGAARDISGFHMQSLGHVVGLCHSVIAAPENPRYVRWLGEAAEVASRALHADPTALESAIAAALLGTFI